MEKEVEEKVEENKADRHKSRARNSISNCLGLKRKKVKCDRPTDQRTNRPTR